MKRKPSTMPPQRVDPMDPATSPTLAKKSVNAFASGRWNRSANHAPISLITSQASPSASLMLFGMFHTARQKLRMFCLMLSTSSLVRPHHCMNVSSAVTSPSRKPSKSSMIAQAATAAAIRTPRGLANSAALNALMTGIPFTKTLTKRLDALTAATMLRRYAPPKMAAIAPAAIFTKWECSAR